MITCKGTNGYTEMRKIFQNFIDCNQNIKMMSKSCNLYSNNIQLK